MTTTTDRSEAKASSAMVGLYQSITETMLRASLSDAEVDRLCDRQERIVRKLRVLHPGATIRELNEAPWIEVTP